MEFKGAFIKYSSIVFKYLSDLFYPPICFYCKDYMKHDKVLCDKCLGHVNSVVSKKIDITPKYQVKVFAISDYKDPLRSLILSKGISDIVTSRRLGELMWDMTYVSNADFDFIVPIPLHWSRFASRGFNQAQEIASVIAKKSGKGMINILKRKKMTKRQSGLTSEKRIENLKDAFSLNIKDVESFRGKHLLIVDDLMTTSSTIRMAARTLMPLKPKFITAVVVCRVI